MCEGYTDVIGFHRAGVPDAVATCGTALTEDHVTAARSASPVGSCWPSTPTPPARAPPSGSTSGSASSTSRWRWLDCRRGTDPGELAGDDPDALRQAVEEAEPFLGFRVGRVLRAGGRSSRRRPKAKLADAAMAVISEHPDVNVRELYAGQVAQHTGLPVADLVQVAERRSREVEVRAGRAAGV